MKIKKGDKVKIITGKDKGREGEVLKVFPRLNQIVVKGLNQVKKHIKAKSEKEPGGIITLEKPLAIGKVMVICPECGKAARIGYQLDKDGKKYRICRKCKSLIDSAKKRK